MSPKVDSSKASVVTRSAWSRDVRPNTAGVTYVRRSYYYDREFSDSIIPPTTTGDFERFAPEGFTTVRPRSGRQSQGARRGGGAERHVLESDERWVDPFTRGRVLQSASGGGGDGDEYESVFELQDCGPNRPAQAPSSAQSQASIDTDTTLADSDLNLWSQ
ncbi:hypothetical protein GGR51DRAFT_528529 [Nemania sp. FL0031]|nr:hypothetical protein GGR51DRAFT_528529 [Nemania sp. FL0031]